MKGTAILWMRLAVTFFVPKKIMIILSTRLQTQTKPTCLIHSAEKHCSIPICSYSPEKIFSRYAYEVFVWSQTVKMRMICASTCDFWLVMYRCKGDFNIGSQCALWKGYRKNSALKAVRLLPLQKLIVSRVLKKILGFPWFQKAQNDDKWSVVRGQRNARKKMYVYRLEKNKIVRHVRYR